MPFPLESATAACANVRVLINADLAAFAFYGGYADRLRLWNVEAVLRFKLAVKTTVEKYRKQPGPRPVRSQHCAQHRRSAQRKQHRNGDLASQLGERVGLRECGRDDTNGHRL